MKKYNTPEIEALALETIDVIATSGNEAAKYALLSKAGIDVNQTSNYNEIESQISEAFNDNGWQW